MALTRVTSAISGDTLLLERMPTWKIVPRLKRALGDRPSVPWTLLHKGTCAADDFVVPPSKRQRGKRPHLASALEFTATRGLALSHEDRAGLVEQLTGVSQPQVLDIFATFSEAARDDCELVTAAVRINKYCLEEASTLCQADEGIVMAAIDHEDGQRILIEACESLHDSSAFMRKAAKRHVRSLSYLSCRLMRDRAFMLTVVMDTGVLLPQYHGRWLGDGDFMLSAMVRDVSNLKLATRDLKNDKDFMLSAVRLNAEALEMASDVLRTDYNVVVTAMARDESALRFASTSLREARGVELLVAARALRGS